MARALRKSERLVPVGQVIYREEDGSARKAQYLYVVDVIAPYWADEKGVSIRMVVNEEGKLHGLDWNPKATTLYGYHPDYIAGNALIVGVKGDELIALKRSAAEEIMRVFQLEHEEIKESGLTMEEFFKKAEEEGEKA